MAVHANQSLAEVRVGGHAYPLKTAPGCRMCSSRHRLAAERLVVSGCTWSTVVASLPPDAGLSPRNVRDHIKNGHLPIKEASVQEFAQRQAEERGEVVAVGVEHVMDHLQFARSILGRVSKRLATGEVEPTVRDALTAADLLARYSPEPQVLDERAVLLGFIEYHETAAELMDTETFREFRRRLDKNEVLTALAEDWESRRRLLSQG